MNWPLRSIEIEILKSRSKKHKGEYKILIAKASCMFSNPFKEERYYFKTKGEALEFLSVSFEALTRWID